MKVSIKVRLFAGMRGYAGVKDADVQGKDVGEVLDSLVNAYPLLKTQIFKEDGDILPHVRVLLNGIAISDMDTELKIGDELAVFPPVGGG
ncbi:MAG: ubiquitin-like small modifier protein 1 [Candidatus Methanoperedens sp.]|nr:ubiquitin-like small modifier protein 1 [Candidatus Methanoperedens sp.]